MSRSVRWLALSLLLLSGACSAAGQASMTPATYASFQTALRTNPNVRGAQTAQCIREGTAKPQAHREALAAQLGTNLEDAVPTYCESLTRALATGDISYEDASALMTGRADPATAARVLEAVRKHSQSLEGEVAEQLGACAQLYADAGQPGVAAGIGQHATRMRALAGEHLEADNAAAAGRSYPASSSLGFAPDQQLMACVLPTSS